MLSVYISFISKHHLLSQEVGFKTVTFVFFVLFSVCYHINKHRLCNISMIYQLVHRERTRDYYFLYLTQSSSFNGDTRVLKDATSVSFRSDVFTSYI